MRDRLPLTLMQNRVRDGHYGSDDSYGMTGAFQLIGPNGVHMLVMSSDGNREGEGWEHVSVSMKNRTPNWGEMCFVKDIFWTEHETVVQFHPPKSEYVNFHPYCLHLWRHKVMSMPMPPSLLVGPKS